MDRLIVLDTETTGLNPKGGDRVVEIGCIAIIDGMIKRDDYYHQYINPQRDMPYGAFRIHGISEEFLSDKPVFADIVDDFMDYIGNDRFIIHNAEFDMKFLSYEMKLINKPQLPIMRAIDTLHMARKKFPGQSVSLDALCKKFDIDLSQRKDKGHGALLDSELLAEVYIELNGGKQESLELSEKKSKSSNIINNKEKKIHEARDFPVSDEELKAHNEFVKQLTESLWYSNSSL